MLLWALNPDNPYGYYRILRVVIFVTAGFAAKDFAKSNRRVWLWLMVITGMLYNPFVPMHLEREVWEIINLLTVVLMVWSAVALRRKG